MNTVHVVTENAGYDVGMVVRGVFSTREKADAWIAAARDQHARKVRDGNAAGWGGPTYDIEEYRLDEGAP